VDSQHLSPTYQKPNRVKLGPNKTTTSGLVQLRSNLVDLNRSDVHLADSVLLYVQAYRFTVNRTHMCKHIGSR
jgi:hypothetical protein